MLQVLADQAISLMWRLRHLLHKSRAASGQRGHSNLKPLSCKRLGTTRRFFRINSLSVSSKNVAISSSHFHFQSDRLWMVFIDDFSALGTSQKIELDAWIVSENLTCAAAELHLSAANIFYRKADFPYNDNGVHLITNAGVVLAFSGAVASQIHLHSLCRKAED